MHNPGFKLLGVLHEYTCGPFVARLVIAAPAALRHENLCITPAWGPLRGWQVEQKELLRWLITIF